MPNRKIIHAFNQRRRANRLQARRVHRRYGTRVPELIARLGSHSQRTHDKAFELLFQMCPLIVDDLIGAFTATDTQPFVQDELASLLGMSGDERARKPLWRHMQRVLDNPVRASLATMNLSSLGDDRVLPLARKWLSHSDPDVVSNAVTTLVAVGQMNDIESLRSVHRRWKDNSEIRIGVANAILAIVGEADRSTVEDTLDDIRENFRDRVLWEDIWGLMEQSFSS